MTIDWKVFEPHSPHEFVVPTELRQLGMLLEPCIVGQPLEVLNFVNGPTGVPTSKSLVLKTARADRQLRFYSSYPTVRSGDALGRWWNNPSAGFPKFYYDTFSEGDTVQLSSIRKFDTFTGFCMAVEILFGVLDPKLRINLSLYEKGADVGVACLVYIKRAVFSTPVVLFGQAQGVSLDKSVTRYWDIS